MSTSMADSSSSPDDYCVCVFAFQVPRKNIEENKEQFVVDVRVSTGSVSGIPICPVRYHSSNKTTFSYSRNQFISMSEADINQITYTIVQRSNIPFALENIHWGRKFPADKSVSEIQRLEKVVSRLAHVAGDCARKNENLCINITNFHRISQPSQEEYEKKGLMTKAKGPLDDWIKENENDLNFNSCHQFIYEKLARKYPQNNPYFGVKSVAVERGVQDGDEDKCSCSICMKEMKKGSQAIQMPCSHIFHGFCIFRWLRVNSTCPLCRFKLFE